MKLPFMIATFFSILFVGLRTSEHLPQEEYPSVAKLSTNLSNETAFCEQSYDDGIFFGFGDEMVCEKNGLVTTMAHPYETAPSVTCIGDIIGSFSPKDTKVMEAAFAFPSSHEGTSVITISSGTNMITKSIFSVPFGDGKVAVSLLSTGSARYLAGLLPNQSLFDGNPQNDDRQSGSDNKEEQTRVVIGNGSVSGFVKWKYPVATPTLYPLAGAKVKLTFLNSWGEINGYTNASGYFNLAFNNMWAALYTFEVTLHIYWENDLIKVIRSNNSVYEHAEVVPMQNGQDYVYPKPIEFTIGKGDDYGEASSIYSAANVYAERAKYLNGGQGFTQCSFRYPESSGFDYSSDTHLVRVNSSSDSAGIHPLSYEAWDVLGHEYGHHLQTVFGFSAEAGGSHSSGDSDIEAIYSDGAIHDDADAKDRGTRLAWNESWPTFFETVAQKSAPSIFWNICVYRPSDGSPRPLGDNFYTGRRFSPDYSLDNNEVLKGEGCERTIMCFLFKLYESNNSASYDSISISEENLWTIVISSKPKKFYEFVSAVASTLSTDRLSDFGRLLAGFQLSPSALYVSATQNSYASLPTFSWNGGGYGFSTASFGYKHFENTVFTLKCFDSSKSLLFAKDNISSCSYQLSELQWNKVLMTSGTNYFVMVLGYSSLGGLTGPYYSRLFAFSKPSILQSTPNLTSLSAKRFFEQTIGIPASGKWRMSLSFPYSGKKAIQTFGDKDTKIWLYQADGTTLISSNDDSGYGTNAFICLEAAANTTYILEIGYYNSSVSGETKVSITPFVGCLTDGQTSFSSYESFVNINTYQTFTWSSYLFGNSSKIVTWSPPVDGNYTVRLESDFDNYLYVIDPTSSAPLVENVHYNDDSNGSNNASLTNNYSSSKKYYVVYAEYNNGNDLGNDNSIVVKFIKN